jgi:preprotein translocase subunit SecG
MSDLVCVEQSGMMFWTHFSNIMAVTGFMLLILWTGIGIYLYLLFRKPSKSSVELKSDLPSLPPQHTV